MVAVPTTIFPVSERFIGIARETTTGTAVNPGSTIPVTSFQPEDKPIWLMDEAWRASMAGEYDMLQGPIWTETSMAGPAYGDTIGNLFYNILGDYVSTGTTTGTSTTINNVSGYPAGTTGSITVTSGTAFSAGAPGFVQIGTGTSAEVVAYNAAATTTITLSGTTRFAHANSVTVTQVTGPYTNGFGLLNGGNGQPPSHTFTDRTQVPGSANQSAVQYAYGCVSKLTLTGNAQGLFTYDSTLTSYSHAYPSAPVTPSISTVRAQPNWHSLVGIGGPASGGTLVNNVAEWVIELTRVVEPIPTNDGSQNPFVIARGKFTATCNMKFYPAIDETPLTNMLSNSQPQVQILFSNGLAGTSNVTYTFDMARCAFDTSKINESGALFGYDNTAKLIANTTNGTPASSGGYSPIYVTLANNTPTY